MKYINIKIPMPIIIIILVIPVLYYVYGFYKFETRVKIYNENIQVGDPLAIVLALMGKPSEFSDHTSFNVNGEERPAIIIIYYGIYYLRENILLVFDYETKTLIHKERSCLVIF